MMMRKGENMTERIAIAGCPKSGKTTYADTLDGVVMHTDDVMHLGWSEASEEVSQWFDDDEVAVIEGVAVLRALRKWLARNPEGKPIDKLLYFYEPFVELTPRQAGMMKSDEKAWDDIIDDLLRRGVVVKDACVQDVDKKCLIKKERSDTK